MTPPLHRPRTQWGALTVAVAMLGLAAVFVGWRVAAPGSCALLFPTAAQWSESGSGPGVIGDCSPAARLVSAWSTMLFVGSLFLVSGYTFVRRRTDPAVGALLLLASGLLASTTVAVVLGFAAVQMIVHMIYFLHMNTKSEGGWNMLALIFTLVLVVITLSGSIWVMYHMDHNMMPSMMDTQNVP